MPSNNFFLGWDSLDAAVYELAPKICAEGKVLVPLPKSRSAMIFAGMLSFATGLPVSDKPLPGMVLVEGCHVEAPLAEAEWWGSNAPVQRVAWISCRPSTPVTAAIELSPEERTTHRFFWALFKNALTKSESE